MAFQISTNGKVLYREFNLSSYLNSYDVDLSQDNPQTTVFGNTAHTRIPGLIDGGINLAGFYDPTATTGSDVVLNAAIGAATVGPLTVFPYSDTIGYRCYLMGGHCKGYKPTGKVGDVVSISAEFEADKGLRQGVSLHALGAETGTGAFTSVDNAAASTGGYKANLHVTAVDTLTTATLKLQHSTDDAVWADLVSFTNFTAVASETLDGTGTVNRYRRANLSTLTGTSVTFAVALATW